MLPRMSIAFRAGCFAVVAAGATLTPRRVASAQSHASTLVAVLAHPDDESFGLGAVIDTLAAGGATVHILCYTHGEASTLNETRADLRRAREQELSQACERDCCFERSTRDGS